jgi:hypothetical protein
MILVPFRADWSSPVLHSLGYLTEVLTSRSGREQRRALRNKPRRRVEWRSLLRGADFRTFRSFLAARPEDDLYLADETRRLFNPISQESADTAITLDDATPDWVFDGAVLVIEHPFTHDRRLRTVSDLTGSVVTFSTALGADFPGGVVLRPCFKGVMAEQLSGTLLTSGVSQVPLAFEVDPGSEPAPAPGLADATFNDLEVFEHRPNWSSPIEIEDAFTGETVDYQTGVLARHRPVAFPIEARRSQHLLRRQADFDQVLGVFHRAEGRRGEFYLPSGTTDIVLAATVASGASVWPVVDSGPISIADAYDDHPIYRAFEVRMRSGAVHRFKVTGTSTSGGLSRLHTATNAPANIAPSDVLSIGWMPVCRFASDDLALEYLTPETVRATIGTVTIEGDPT